MKDKSIRKLDIEQVKMATHFNRQHLSEWFLNAERAFADKDRKKREEEQLCRWCFYAMRTRIGGAKITQRDCDGCGTEMTFMSTSTDHLCKDCGLKHGLCVRCSADIDLCRRNKLERARK